MPRPTLFRFFSLTGPRASRSGRLLPLLLAVSLTACDASEPSARNTSDSAPTVEEVASQTAAGTVAKAVGQVTSASENAAVEVTVPTLYVGGRLQTAGRPARDAELVYAVTWDGIDPAKLKWTEMRTGEEGNFVIELPGNLRQFSRELELVLRPRKPANSPFKFLRTNLPYPLPQGPVNLGSLTIERREMPEATAQALDG